MPAILSQWSTTADEKAAWQDLDAAESELESMLRRENGTIAKIGGWGYYLDDAGRMVCAPLMLDESLDVEMSFHRSEYEGLSEQDMREIARNVRAWIQSNSGKASAAA